MTKIRTFEDVFQSSDEVLGFQAASAFGNFLSDLPNGERDVVLDAVSRRAGPAWWRFRHTVAAQCGVRRRRGTCRGITFSSLA